MTQDEIIKMASKVDLSPVFQIYPRELENFVKLVEKNELERMREVFRVALLDAKKRKWVGLTDEEIEVIEALKAPPVHPDFVDCDDWMEFARAIEAKLKEKNT